MDLNKNEQCEQILHYLTGDLSKMERLQFETHLEKCVNCQQELEELQAVWNSIPMQMELVDPPPGLKEEVFSAIFSDEKVMPLPERKKRWNPFSTGMGKIAAALLLIVAGMSWSNLQLRSQLTAMENQQSVPMKMMQQYKLVSSITDKEGVSGVAYLLQSGSQRRLVVYMDGLPSNEGLDAYQVWLIHDGKRENAGTVRVGNGGSGILTYTFSDPNMKLDAIGVTLEPDPFGNEPRGKKILGTT